MFTIVFESSESLEAIISNIAITSIQTTEFIEEENDSNIFIPRVFTEIIDEITSGRYWCRGSFATTPGNDVVKCHA